MENENLEVQVSQIRSFEELYDVIQSVVERWRSKWTLKAVASISFDDIKQIILVHVDKKWEQYDQTKPVEPWVAKIARNQFINELRNNYLSTASPCSDCPMNLGGDECKLFKKKGPQCEYYKVWLGKNKFRHDCRLPLPLENHSQEVNNLPDRYIDVERSALLLHKKMEPFFTDKEWKIYEKLFVEQKSEQEAALELGFKTNEKGRICGYARFAQVKKKAIRIAKRILNDEGLE